MNFKTWIKIGGILAVLMGAAPMLAVAQEHGGNRAEESHFVHVDNNRYHYRRHYYRDSHYYSRHYHRRHYYRDSHYYNRGHYSRRHREGYQNR